MSLAGHRILQAVLFLFSIYMLWGGGFFWRETLADSAVRTNTYTLYRSVPPPPVGPRFCQFADTGTYGLVGPCNLVPPFVWWLEKRIREKNYSITL